nr:glycosyltransferase [Sulfobacillus harzensis]
MEPEKGFPETAGVFLELLRLGVPVTWTIVGDGSERANLLRHLRQNGALRQVRWTGFQAHPEEWLEHCNLFVLLSRQEAFGNAFVEANSMGLPMVAPRIGGIPEHLIDGCNGMAVNAVDARNIRAAALAIRALYRTPRRWQTLRRGAILEAEQFSLTTMAEEYLAVYRWAEVAKDRLDAVGS